MQKLKHSIHILILGILAFSCGDDPLPSDPFTEPETAIFAEMISNDSIDYLIDNPNASVFTFEVEYNSLNNGEDIKAHEWFVYHRNRATGEMSDTVRMDSISSSLFDISLDTGLPRHTFTFALNDALAKLNKTINDVNGGDDIIYDGEIIMEDDRRFGPDSAGVSVQNGVEVDGAFRIVKTLFCPSDLEGEYISVASGISTDPCCIADTIVVDTLVMMKVDSASANNRRYTISDFTANLYLVWYGPEGGDYGLDSMYVADGGLRDTLNDVCDSIFSEITGPFGETVEISGKVVDFEAGLIEYKLINSYGDEINIELTRQ